MRKRCIARQPWTCHEASRRCWRASSRFFPGTTRLVLDGAAVAGDPFEPELAAAAAGLPEETLLEALDMLLRRDLIRHTDVPRRFRFRHPLVRAVPSTRLAGRVAPRRTRAQRAGAGRAPRAGDRRALTTSSAPRATATSPPSLSCGRRARRLCRAHRQRPRVCSAPRSGCSTPDAPERLDLLTRAGEAPTLRPDQFKEAYAAMLDSLALMPGNAAASAVRLTVGCARLENLLGHHQRAHDRLTAGLQQLSDRTSPDAVSLMLELAVDAFYRMDYVAMRDWAQLARSAARPLGDRALTASAARHHWRWRSVYSGAVALAHSGCEEAASLVDAMPDEELVACLDLAVDTLAGAEVLPRPTTARPQRMSNDRWRSRGRPVRASSFPSSSGRARSAPCAAACERRPRSSIQRSRSRASQGTPKAWRGISLPARWRRPLRAMSTPLSLRPRRASTRCEALTGASRRREPAWPSPPRCLMRRIQHARSRCCGSSRAVMTWPSSLPCGAPAAFELLTRCQLALGEREEAARIASAHAGGYADALGLPMAVAMADRAAAAVALDSRRPALGRRSRAALGGAPRRASGRRSRPRDRGALAGRALAQAGQTDRAAIELQRAAAAFDACAAPRRRDAAERELGQLGRRP